MTDWPTDLVRVPTMRCRPESPQTAPVQVCWYRATLEDGIYRIRNIDDLLLHENADWNALCDEMRWYPLGNDFVRPSIYGAEQPTLPTRAPATPAESPHAEPPPIDYTKPLVPRRLTLAELEREGPQVELVILIDPLPARPVAPLPGQSIEILGYTARCKTTKSYRNGAPYYHLYNYRGEVLSLAYEWDPWCHQLGWFPLDGLAPSEAIPRAPKPEGPPAEPRRPSGPYVVNRHWYASRNEIPEPWIYVGRGTPLGNEFTVQDHGPKLAMKKYRLWLWERICERHPAVLAELGRITTDTSLVCSCKSKPGATNPCHADVIVKAWRWIRDRAALNGYRAGDSVQSPEWTDEPDASVPVIERREPAQNLDLFGEPA